MGERLGGKGGERGDLLLHLGGGELLPPLPPGEDSRVPHQPARGEEGQEGGVPLHQRKGGGGSGLPQ